MLLWETLTGGDVRFTAGRQAPLDYKDRQEYASFRKECGLALSDYIALEGERLLLYNNINEPVAWQPEPKTPAGQAWRSPPGNVTRHLPGWQAPSRQVRLRRSSSDYTARMLASSSQKSLPRTSAPPAVTLIVSHRSGQLAIEWPDR